MKTVSVGYVWLELEVAKLDWLLGGALGEAIGNLVVELDASSAATLVGAETGVFEVYTGV